MDVFWNYRKFLYEVNRWCQGNNDETEFAPISTYCLHEMLGCTYRELLQEPFEMVVQHIQIKRRIDHYNTGANNADR